MISEQLWESVLGELELTISKANFTTWFKNTFIVSLDNDSVVIGVPNAFTKAWLENKYNVHIISALNKNCSSKINNILYKVVARGPISTEVGKAVIAPPTAIDQPKNEPVAGQSGFGLNPKYKFESFIVGRGNDLATAAAKAVVERPGEVYNPLFLYGGVGLGKTHLLHAIGSGILAKNPKAKIVCINSEHFVNDFINSIKRGMTDDLKRHYRSADVLLIDDIQFIAGKEQTQEEFFHTFNELHQKNKQIVLTSDRPPKAIAEIEQRLISRFEWGMIADISTPDLETRCAILESKCAERGFSICPEIIAYIAENVQNNIRELEGALNRIIAYHQLNNTSSLSLDIVQNVLGSLSLSVKKSGLTPKKITTKVADYFDISTANLVGISRRKELVVPRQIVMWLMREELKSSYPSIGQELGGRDHTTAIHACNKIENEMKINSKLKSDIDLIRQQLYAS
ncbi:MAG: chromosomal replication initiator protein DnaA [Candidatus Magasanikbacteria bacterium CG_4_9_14_3_um_filter_32_9]|uniref:Chromosomal replication initiator protein DnaA n=2 Tax=Parcubacteria group TaxID=1794811 RepID=A0A2M7VD84_9BACT|nr:MAG: chromosomal replication initiator protein DnaA [Candidatus Komeilibacteria bacterium CG_4_10_14_0_2_um_filter_37_10]PJA89818.1 MAG: chromosomal replication initiator protein DnaA [Candidatus Magasanikbacteria bacterium CG_4_9_14_3_um_filter_32_9]